MEKGPIIKAEILITKKNPLTLAVKLDGKNCTKTLALRKDIFSMAEGRKEPLELESLQITIIVSCDQNTIRKLEKHINMLAPFQGGKDEITIREININNATIHLADQEQEDLLPTVSIHTSLQGGKDEISINLIDQRNGDFLLTIPVALAE